MIKPPYKIIRRLPLIFLIVLIIILVGAAGLGGWLYYLYHHPESLKPHLERYISRLAGISLHIDQLNYSLEPMTIRLKGISIRKADALDLKIEDMNVAMTRTVSGGRKKLIIEQVDLNDFSGNIRRIPNLSGTSFESRKTSSFFLVLFNKLKEAYLFQDLEFDILNIRNGLLSIQPGRAGISINRITARMTGSPEMIFDLRVEHEDTILNIPQARVSADGSLLNRPDSLHIYFSADDLSYRGASAAASGISLQAGLIVDRRQKSLFLASAHLSCPKIVFNPDTGEENITPPLAIDAGGNIDLNQKNLADTHIDLTLGSLMNLKAILNGNFGENPGLNVDIVQGVISPEKLRPFIPLEARTRFDPFLVEGNVLLTGELTLSAKKNTKFQDPSSWNMAFKGSLNGLALNYRNKSTRARGFLSSDVEISGRWPRYEAQVHLKSPDAHILVPWGSFNPRGMELTVEIEHPRYHIRNLRGTVVQAGARLGEREFPINDISIGLPSGYIDLGEKSFDLPGILVSTQSLGNARISLKGGPDDFELALKCEDSHLLKSAYSWHLLPRNWPSKADEALQLKAAFKKDADCAFASLLSLDNLTLSNDETTIMGENISMSISLAGYLNVRNRNLELDLNLRSQKGELLLDRFYFNFDPNPVSLSSRIRTDIPGKRLDVSQLKLKVKDIITINLNGQAENIFGSPDFQFNFLIPRIPVKPVFQNFIRDPFQPESAGLKELDLGGHISADLNLKGYKGLTGVKGKICLDDLDLNLPDQNLSLEGVNLELPLWYEKQALQPPGPDMEGKLFIKSLTAPWVPKQSLSLALEANQNRISVESPTEITIPGGTARFGPIRGRDIFSNPVVETSLTLDNIALKPWFDRFRILDIQGTLTGRLSPVLFSGSRVTSAGKMTAHMAGGEIVLSDLHLSQLNTPAPVFGLDGIFHRLDLAEITADTAFGKIQGRLEGYIKNLEIAYGQPQRFDLLLETVKERGVPQRISVEAVENIAKLGGGQSPFMGLAGLYITFLKDFPYRKIGLHTSLKNDVFRINGTIKEGGQEYIVKRGLYGVNIINRDTDNRIRFKEMVKRIKNLDLSKTKPIIR